MTIPPDLRGELARIAHECWTLSGQSGDVSTYTVQYLGSRLESIGHDLRARSFREVARTKRQRGGDRDGEGQDAHAQGQEGRQEVSVNK